MRRDSLARAMRPDKLTMAAVAHTLGLYLAGRAASEIPVWQMLAIPLGSLERRAIALAGGVRDGRGEAIETRATVGGGSLPGESVPSWGLALRARSATKLLAALRQGSRPVVGRIEDGRVILDLRTVPDTMDDILATAIDQALATVP
jgi:L-seryl-tRNA(Ser) seleniumtransferase